VDIGAEDAFLLVPLYAVLTAAVLALTWRVLRGEHTKAIPFLVAIPLTALAAYTSLSLLWTADLRAGSIALAFFVFPFAAGTTVVARSPLAAWLPRALGATVVSLACAFALIGLWQAQTRTLFFAPDLEVANAYTTYFRVTSLFKDPSLYGRWLLIAIAVTLIALWLGRVRAALGVGLVAFLFTGLFFSYSQSSFVALFVVTFALTVALGVRRLRLALAAAAVATLVAAGAVAAATVMGADGRDATSGRSKLARITLEAWETAPVVGVGIGGQPKVSHEQARTISVRRSASHATPLTVLAELGVIGFALYVALLAAAAVALSRVTRVTRSLGLGLSATFAVLVVHSLLYAGFFEDPLTWGVLGIAAAVLVGSAREPVA
jgi:O-antigen ligase